MEEVTLRQLVTEVCGEATEGEYRVRDGDSATVLLNVRTGLEPVEEVQRIRITPGFVVVSTREATYWVGAEHVLGLRVRQAPRGGAGF
jgi:hypothetical protein